MKSVNGTNAVPPAVTLAADTSVRSTSGTLWK
jgi:hypothetical protein